MICCIYLHAVIRDFFSVIPANAGVILMYDVRKQMSMRYPRECGGDPVSVDYDVDNVVLSPRMRG